MQLDDQRQIVGRPRREDQALGFEDRAGMARRLGAMSTGSDAHD